MFDGLDVLTTVTQREVLDFLHVHQVAASSMGCSDAVQCGPKSARLVKTGRIACWISDNAIVWNGR